ncbi:hypothetical protein HDV01_007020 [Terramyces sp. JEL0728]|nr:hypothetical protein HDV01_007020 [Terramyces sp. JEL0728]
MNRIVLFSKKYCGLCEEALFQLRQIQQAHPFELKIVDIEKRENKQYYKYQYDIPVIHLNDKKIMQHRVDNTELISQLNKK